MEPANITVIGDLMVDHIFFINRLPAIGESLPAEGHLKGPGGKGANAAIATYRACYNDPELSDSTPYAGTLDISVRMVGVIGDDEDGKYLMKPLRENNIDVTGVRTFNTMPTGMAFIMVQEVDDTRDNRLVYTAGVNASVKADDFTTVESLSNGTRPGLIISQLVLDLKAVEKILETAGKAGIKVLLNAAPAMNVRVDLYRHVTHLVVNETEVAILSGNDLSYIQESSWKEISEVFLGYGVENVVITLGDKGAFFANRHGSGHLKAFIVDVVDSTGAGDAFVGAYAAEHVRQGRPVAHGTLEKPSIELVLLVRWQSLKLVGSRVYHLLIKSMT